ncbi:MAG: DUF6127 family protein [Proteobacteria bacterium]|nr:DUF6127 family protein [Pseudomonadota bacterium]
MAKPNKEQNDKICLPKDEFEAMLCRAAEKGARCALADVGLDGEDAANDIRELRSLMSALQLAKKTAWQTFIRIVTSGIMLAIMAGIAIKLKLFGVK